jgi:hypothetical protein
MTRRHPVINIKFISKRGVQACRFEASLGHAAKDTKEFNLRPPATPLKECPWLKTLRLKP